ncbi:acyl-CoA desaturase-like [Galendromus occidentalis]|uniref:Acyl-CoA desaturase-like n=1 Tax=Galendromus occidentalis TaxID=34638 RepID=A0AAJ6VYE0_9ACAR|nr:acyl-CoA desaturase-like [Galendromus occidentalis]
MLLLEVLRFGHRDWYSGEICKEDRPSDNNNSAAKQPSVSFVDDYFKAPLLHRVAWGCSMKLIVIHILGIYSLVFLGHVSWSTLAFQFVYLVLSGLSVTAGAHRLWTHRSYKARTPFRTFLMLCNTIAAQNDIYEWCRDHRVHHKFSDTNADPHNIDRGLFFSHIGWLMIKKHPDVYKYGSRIDCSDLIGDPVVRFNMRYYGWLVLLFSFGLPTLLPHFLFGDAVLPLFMLCFLRLTLSFNFTWSVNSFAHHVGDRPFDRNMKPSEVLWVSVVAAGEGWHNYHHTFPHDYNCSELGWHINWTTMLIDLMASIGQVTERRTISKAAIMRQKLRNGDGTRLPRRIREMSEKERLQLADTIQNAA